MTIKLSTDRKAVVDTDLHWIPVAKEQPPRGAKVQLIDRKLGSATSGTWYPGNSWTHWFPIPTFNPNEDA
jgi:hypothetical protein